MHQRHALIEKIVSSLPHTAQRNLQWPIVRASSLVSLVFAKEVR
jgi:hypothetical protein